MLSNPQYFQIIINANELPPEFSCFREANLLPRGARQIQNLKEKVREITRQTHTLVPRRPTRLSSLPTMLDICGRLLVGGKTTRATPAPWQSPSSAVATTRRGTTAAPGPGR